MTTTSGLTATDPATFDSAAPGAPVEHADPTFPSLHVRPPRGWVNDPNGVALIDGTYHVFFQHNPDDPLHDAIRWGHASSHDLLHWSEEPIALAPRPGELDSHGCWTGTVIDDGGVPTAVYSAVADTSGRSAVLLARSDRTLRTWVQERTPVAGMPDDPAITDVRDPFLFEFEGHRYAIQGAGRRGGTPSILLYACDDLERWSELGTLLNGEHPVASEHAQADIWECPNLVHLDGRWILIVSLWRWVQGKHALTGVAHLVGDLVRDGASLRFEPTSGGAVDDGPAFYAPQVLALPERALLWAWSWELGRSQEQVAQAGWAGVLTFPRELYLDNGHLASRPADELSRLRGAALPWHNGSGFTARAFEATGTGPAQLLLGDGQGERLVVEVGSDRGVDAGHSEHQQEQEPWRILVDGSLVEVFAGPTPTTTRAYPSSDSSWVLRAAQPGQVRVHRLELPED
ncbi:glycoside hydrolase family 32 protein [Kineococcus arenarius]|uniref:glycoside hydrolase family 32 protein n=1 Tax=Kineococcus sp. SYSU DK007 TaxID=3383128 RepID=UPI003D7E8764